ncbi:amidohydrolase family protein [Novosphingobium sp. FKTRR1]|uniref:amidohydrolase family protein n=1 Tax=Novosphingobium sp. FKTRR1 TaxID=2879118 RepID=UPI001CF041CC|nr:amidohydrolase family protein [Novosphingobium sp. FKTRR1]
MKKLHHRALPIGLAAFAMAALLCGGSVRAAAAADRFDLVITGGRVMDPETGTDRVLNVGVKNGQIAALTAEPLNGAREVDAHGLVVGPGFIDLHSHAQYPLGYDLQARDGVTTALELEAGVYPIAPFYAARAGRTRINYGASVGVQSIRIRIKTGQDDSNGPFNAIFSRKAEWAETAFTPQERAEQDRLLADGLAQGGLGVGLLYEYLPGLARDEVLEMFGVAGKVHAPVFVHARAAERSDPDHLLAPLQEMIADSAATGAPVHYCHIGSKGQGSVDLLLGLMDGARAHGVDVTTEVYPYDAAGTILGSSIFNPGWQGHIGIDYKDVEWPPTGERLTAESFEKFRKEFPSAGVILHMIPEAGVLAGISHPGVMIISDAGEIVNGAGHPRSTGTFARTLGVYVREKHAVSLMDALGKMTLLPARRMEGVAPMMRHKGRVQVGADADLTLFDPDKVKDLATFRKPAEPSTGIPYVIVAGQLVVDHGAIVTTAYPGKGVIGNMH